MAAPGGPGSKKAIHDLARLPTRTDTTVAANLPESRRYRIKRVLLGPPLVSEDLHGQRLGKPKALAVLSSDVMSSSAYATEEMLRILVPIAGLAASSIITPMTAAILSVLAVVTMCYRDVVRSYPKAGGSYVVSRDNFGPNVARVAGAALLTSYTITVAVSVAVGADAIVSAVPALGKQAWVPVVMSIAFVLLLAYGNLRGIREAGRVFAIPTYFFISNMALLIVFGLVRQLGHDRDGSHLQRRQHLSEAASPERTDHAGSDEHNSRGAAVGEGAWIAPDGTVRLNPLRWPAAAVGLPTRRVELPVRGGGHVVGTFILTPTPSTHVSHEQCMVAVALADQLGASVATQSDGD